VAPSAGARRQGQRPALKTAQRGVGRPAGLCQRADNAPAQQASSPAPPCSPPPLLSKGGNNNTYCHDSPLNYFDWDAATQDKDGLVRFVRHMIGIRQAPQAAGAGSVRTDLAERGQGPGQAKRRLYLLRHGSGTAARVPGRHPRLACVPVAGDLACRLCPRRRAHREVRRRDWVGDGDVEWHGLLPGEPDWTEASRFLAFELRRPGGGGLYVAFNTGHLPVVAELPRREGRVWQLLVDTSKASAQWGPNGAAGKAPGAPLRCAARS
jgi:isoamylase